MLELLVEGIEDFPRLGVEAVAKPRSPLTWGKRRHRLEAWYFELTKICTARLRSIPLLQQLDIVVVLQKSGLELIDFRTLEGKKLHDVGLLLLGDLQSLAGLCPRLRGQTQALVKRLVVLQLYLELVAFLFLLFQKDRHSIVLGTRLQLPNECIQVFELVGNLLAVALVSVLVQILVEFDICQLAVGL